MSKIHTQQFTPQQNMIGALIYSVIRAYCKIPGFPAFTIMFHVHLIEFMHIHYIKLKQNIRNLNLISYVSILLIIFTSNIHVLASVEISGKEGVFLYLVNPNLYTILTKFLKKIIIRNHSSMGSFFLFGFYAKFHFLQYFLKDIHKHMTK